MLTLEDLKDVHIKNATNTNVLLAILEKAYESKSNCILITKKELSELCNVSVRTIYRSLLYFKEAKYIKYNKTINDNSTITEIFLLKKSMQIINNGIKKTTKAKTEEIKNVTFNIDIDEFKYGFTKIYFNNRWTFVNIKGELIGNGKLWFDEAYDFHEWFAKVKLKNKWSFINNYGELIGNGKLWFENVSNFVNGFAQVKLHDKWSFINSNNNIIGDTWFDYVDSFSNGFARVRLNSKYSFIDTNGRLIGNGKLWFDSAFNFDKGFAQVKLNDSYSFLNSKGELIGNGDIWFNNIYYSYNTNIVKIRKNDKFNFIKPNGELLSDKWFDYAENFSEKGIAKVKINNLKYNLDTNGNLHYITFISCKIPY